jgi:hypothetical protein
VIRNKVQIILQSSRNRITRVCSSDKIKCCRESEDIESWKKWWNLQFLNSIMWLFSAIQLISLIRSQFDFVCLLLNFLYDLLFVDIWWANSKLYVSHWSYYRKEVQGHWRKFSNYSGDKSHFEHETWVLKKYLKFNRNSLWRVIWSVKWT